MKFVFSSSLVILGFASLTEAVCKPSIIGFTLVNADTDSDIGPLVGTVNKATLLSTSLNIRAEFGNCTDNPVESVFVKFDNHTFCEDWKPFSIFQDKNPSRLDLANDEADYYPKDISLGRHKLSATPFTGGNCTGIRGRSLRKNLKVIDCENAVVGFTLIDADADEDIGPLPAIIDKADIDVGLNVRAEVRSCRDIPVDSVFVQFGKHAFCERYMPYAAFQDQNPEGPDIANGEANYFAKDIAAGAYLVKATPYTGDNCTGVAGLPKEKNVTVIDCVNQIIGFTLIDAVADEDIGPLPRVINKEIFDTSHVNIRAEVKSCSASPVDSVLVEFGNHSYCELFTPYSVFQDHNPNLTDLANGEADYLPRNLPKGKNKVKATPFMGPNCSGEPGSPLEKTVRVISCAPRITGWTLINAETDVDIAKLSYTINRSEVGNSLNIRADIKECPGLPIESVLVQFGNHTFCEVYTPYSVFQDKNGSGPDIPNDAADYLPGKIEAGDFVLSSTPYSGEGCSGTAYQTRTILVTVI